MSDYSIPGRGVQGGLEKVKKIEGIAVTVHTPAGLCPVTRFAVHANRMFCGLAPLPESSLIRVRLFHNDRDLRHHIINIFKHTALGRPKLLRMFDMLYNLLIALLDAVEELINELQRVIGITDHAGDFILYGGSAVRGGGDFMKGFIRAVDRVQAVAERLLGGLDAAAELAGAGLDVMDADIHLAGQILDLLDRKSVV